MPDFVYDGVTIATKTNFRGPTAPADKSYEAADWAAQKGYFESLRTGLLTGQYHGYSPRSAGEITALSVAATYRTMVRDSDKHLLFWNGTAIVDLSAGGGGSAHIIQNGGASLTARSKLNFDGAELVATDDVGSDQSDITLAAVLAAKTFRNGAAAVPMLVLDKTAGAGVNQMVSLSRNAGAELAFIDLTASDELVLGTTANVLTLAAGGSSFGGQLTVGGVLLSASGVPYDIGNATTGRWDDLFAKAVDLKYTAGAVGAYSKMATISAIPVAGNGAAGLGSYLAFEGKTSTGATAEQGYVGVKWTDATDGAAWARMIFSLSAGGASPPPVDLASLWGSGDLGIGTGATQPVARLEAIRNSVGSSTTPAIDTVGGVRIANTTTAAAGAQQFSPIFSLSGRGWDSTASASKRVDAGFQLHPVQVAGNPTGELRYLYSVNGGAWATGKISISTRGGGSLRVGSDPGTSDGGATCFLDNDGTGYPLFIANGNQAAATWITYLKTPGGAAFYTVGYDANGLITHNYATAGGYGVIHKGRLAENQGTAKATLTANDWVADFDGPTHVYSGNTQLNRIDFGATIAGGQKITIIFTHATPAAVSGNTATAGNAKGIRLRGGAASWTPVTNDAKTFIYSSTTTFFHEV